MAEKQRIEYIDLIKGIVIVLVVFGHCGIPVSPRVMHMMSFMRMPTFVFLSGLFFSTYGSFRKMLVKKVDRYIIPLYFFTFFYLVALPFRYEYMTIPEFKGFIYDIVVNLSINRVNEHLWFLQMLFCLSVLSFVIERFVKRSSIKKMAVCFLLSIVFFVLNGYLKETEKSFHIVRVLYNARVVQAIVMLPFFYAPFLLKSMILQEHNKRRMWVLLVVAIVALWCCGTVELCHHVAVFGDSYFRLVIGQSAGIYVMYFVGYMLKRVFYFSYVGRYSLIVFATHGLIGRIINAHLGIANHYVMFLIIVISAPAVIWFFRRCFPYFTAQKELLVINEDGRLRIGK